MSTKTIHHIIEILAGTADWTNPEVFDKLSTKEKIQYGHKIIDTSQYFWGHDYYESCLNGNRTMTKADWKSFMHYERHQAWENEQENEDDGYEFHGGLNPGGGSYYM
jgi:hypothetical protein